MLGWLPLIAASCTILSPVVYLGSESLVKMTGQASPAENIISKLDAKSEYLKIVKLLPKLGASNTKKFLQPDL